VQRSELPDAGNNTTETLTVTCGANKAFVESNSVWYKWVISEPGSLSFTILPFDEKDDIDFILFKLNSDSSNCSGKEAVRCMRSGPVLGNNDAVDTKSCTGATGLKPGNITTEVLPGCQAKTDQFLSEIVVEPGEKYALLINNYRSKGGFMLDFGGTSTFLHSPGNCLTSSAYNAELTTTEDGFSISDVYPNPASGTINIPWQSSQNCTAIVQIIDVSGNLLQTNSCSLQQGRGVIPLPSEMLQTGFYFIKIRSGDYTRIARFFKQ
jgi:hypothetical protein